jgi:hypothetical protein
MLRAIDVAERFLAEDFERARRGDSLVFKPTT